MEKERGIYMTSSNRVIFNNKKLQDLLKASRRFSYINGSKQPQCHACVIVCDQNSDKATIFSTVKDGVTSVHELKMECEAGGFVRFVIADISYMLGILKTHGDTVSIVSLNDNTKLLITSDNRSTSLMSSSLCRAYPSSRQTALQQWQKAKDLLGKITIPMRSYRDSNGKLHTPSLTTDLDRDKLVDAFNTSNINGQSVATYTLHNSHNKTVLTSGTTLKGKTSTTLMDFAFPYSIDFGGGLGEVLNYFNDVIILSIFDLRDYGGNFILLFTDGSNVVMQVGVESAN